MKWALIILGAIIAVALIITAIGALLPKGHVASRSAVFNQSAESVWHAITDVESFTSWRTDLKSVERLPDKGGRMVWRETSSQGAMTIEVVESSPPQRLVCRIADPDLPFGGTWTYELAEAGAGTRLTITENGEIYNPIFRFMARFIFGYTSTLETYLKGLGKKFGEQVATE
jgi:uncharacterized protein YndB with AHSA1/START domain